MANPCSWMTCCSGENHPAVLILDDKKVGCVTSCVWLKVDQGWSRCPVDYNGREQDITMIACGETHCAALTTTGKVFTCRFPMKNDPPKWNTIVSEDSTLDVRDPQIALQILVADINSKVRYKGCCDPMSARLHRSTTSDRPRMRLRLLRPSIKGLMMMSFICSCNNKK
jgi:hypothetical protein